MNTEKHAYLSIKIKSLAAEAKLIRKDENEYKRQHKRLAKDSDASRRARATWLGLKDHRRGIVRSESRASLLASAFIRGIPYAALEQKCWTEPDLNRVASIAFRFGVDTGNYASEKQVKNALQEWVRV